jgi:hypothetical protein
VLSACTGRQKSFSPARGFEDLYLSHSRNPAQVYFTLSFESALRGVGIEKETHDPPLVVLA